jgi:hypothetical protein
MCNKLKITIISNRKHPWPHRLDWVKKIQSSARPTLLNLRTQLTSDPSWAVNFDQVTLDKKIGRGSYGDVFKGRLWGERARVCGSVDDGC